MTEYQIVERNYNASKQTHGDIHEHIETLCEYAKRAESVLECGVRTGVSTWAFANGLLNNNKNDKRLISCDLNRDPSFDQREPLLKSLLDFSFWIGSDLDYPDNDQFDIIFIDTWHIYGQLKRELKKFAPMCKKWIIMHDTTVDELYGESLRCGFNIIDQSVTSGFSVEEITKGLWPAITEFLETNKDFILKERFTNCNGLTILERVTV